MPALIQDTPPWLDNTHLRKCGKSVAALAELELINRSIMPNRTFHCALHKLYMAAMYGMVIRDEKAQRRLTQKPRAPHQPTDDPVVSAMEHVALSYVAVNCNHAPTEAHAALDALDATHSHVEALGRERGAIQLLFAHVQAQMLNHDTARTHPDQWSAVCSTIELWESGRDLDRRVHEIRILYNETQLADIQAKYADTREGRQRLKAGRADASSCWRPASNAPPQCSAPNAGGAGRWTRHLL